MTMPGDVQARLCARVSSMTRSQCVVKSSRRGSLYRKLTMAIETVLEMGVVADEDDAQAYLDVCIELQHILEKC